MLTDEIEVEQDDRQLYTPNVDEPPTFGVVDDGRTYPAVTARRRQRNGSRRATIFTVSKNGKYKSLYEQFWKDIIEPYQARKASRQQRAGSIGSRDHGVNNENPISGGAGDTRQAERDWQYSDSIPVNAVDRGS